MFKIGIIGCGKIAQVRHIPEYVQNQDAEFAGFYDLNQERAEQLAKQYGGIAYDSYEAMLADESVDAVSVCVANSDHAKITIEALEAGKHVLCEKPMAMTLEECEAMVEASKRTGNYLMVGHNQRLAKAHAKARELVLEGLIGDILTFRTTFTHAGPETWGIDSGQKVWFFDKKKAVLGAMADLGIHKTDLIQFLTGARVSEVIAYLGTLDKKDSQGNLVEVDDNAICIYRMESGATGTMTAGWTCYGEEDNSTILSGTLGVMKIYYHKEHSIMVELKNGEHIYYDIDQIQTNDNQTKSGVIDLFMECLRTNTPPEISGEEALAAMKAVFAAVESAKTGRSIKIQ